MPTIESTTATPTAERTAASPGGEQAENSEAGSTEEPQEGTEADREAEEETFDAERSLEKIRKLNSENRNLREAKKAAEAKAAVVDERDQRIRALEAENLRIRIGARHGLPDELIDRLRGDSEEEILADAEKLLSLVARRTPPTTKPTERLGSTGDPAEEPEETDLDKIAARMFRR